MKDNKRTVLHVVFSLMNGGTERYLINLINKTKNDYRNIVVYYSGKNYWRDELNEMGVEVIKINNNGISRIKKLKRIMTSRHVDIVYAYSYLNSIYAILAAFISKVKTRIAHAHREEPGSKKSVFKSIISRIIISLLSTDCLACNETAGKSLFIHRRTTIINNGINFERYRFNRAIRDKLRKQLAINDNDIVLGTVGRIDDNKNQKFMIDIIERLNKRSNKYKLVIVGDGENKKNLERYVMSNYLADSVIFIGSTKNAYMYYNMFDVFLLTSHKEGLPFVLVEACVNGLPCFVSDTLNKKMKICPNIKSLRLSCGCDKWAEEIMKTSHPTRWKDSEFTMKKNGYSVEDSLKPVIEIYERGL